VVPRGRYRTGVPPHRGRLADYLTDLARVGVAGVRLDGAKHMAATDIAAILDRVDGDLYVYQEVIDLGFETVGAVTAPATR
jgi:alpha-amylase